MWLLTGLWKLFLNFISLFDFKRYKVICGGISWVIYDLYAYIYATI